MTMLGKGRKRTLTHQIILSSQVKASHVVVSENTGSVSNAASRQVTS